MAIFFEGVYKEWSAKQLTICEYYLLLFFKFYYQIKW